AELRREHDGVPPVSNRAADELLVAADAIHIGRIEQRDTEIERAMNHIDRLPIVRGAVEIAHAHAAEPDARHDGSVRAEIECIHEVPPDLLRAACGAVLKRSLDLSRAGISRSLSR